MAIGNYRDSGGFSFLPQPLAVLAALFDRLGRYESAATISRFAATPLARRAFPEITTAITHLRESLGDDAYESLARAGEHMSNSEVAAYAFDQIELARAALE